MTIAVGAVLLIAAGFLLREAMNHDAKRVAFTMIGGAAILAGLGIGLATS